MHGRFRFSIGTSMGVAVATALVLSTLERAQAAILNGDFSAGLSGWTVSQSGGAATPGSVTMDLGQAVLSEGDSAFVTLQQRFLLPADPTVLKFDLMVTPGFDRSAAFLPDAFEVTVLDGASSPVVLPWDVLATSFFNLQEDGTLHLGSTTAFDGLTATALISGIPVGTPVTVFFDLIGADSDTGSALRIDNVIAVPDPATLLAMVILGCLSRFRATPRC